MNWKKTKHDAIIFLQWIMIKSYIIKSTGEKYPNGLHQTTGLNKYNPISYLLVLVVGVFIGVVYFFKGIKDTWIDSF